MRRRFEQDGQVRWPAFEQRLIRIVGQWLPEQQRYSPDGPHVGLVYFSHFGWLLPLQRRQRIHDDRRFNNIHHRHRLRRRYKKKKKT